VTVQDGASHTLAWLGSVFGQLAYPLGVDEFGQSGARTDLYRHFKINAEAIVAAAFEALEAVGR
jgi:pyruvate dehydrogenase E1 component